jgi:Uma2 family endonuclease
MAIATAPDERTGQQLLPLYRFTVEQYHRMIAAEVFNGSERVELLEGWVMIKMTRNPPHDGTVLLVQTELLARLPAEWVLRVQSAITTPDSEPEPDLVVARGPRRRYVRSHPRPRDVALVVEVADTTLAEDRDIKGPLYARARIPVYWVVNLIDSIVEVYSNPRAGRSPAYRQRQDHGPADALPLVIGGQEEGVIPVRELLP